MISYMDRTFCPYWGNCEAGKGCPRALTEEVKKDAVKWWGSDDAPICVYGSPPQCYEEMEP
jgi:hypothetical protein